MSVAIDPMYLTISSSGASYLSRGAGLYQGVLNGLLIRSRVAGFV